MNDYRLFDYMRHAEDDDMTIVKGLLAFALICGILAFCVFIGFI